MRYGNEVESATRPYAFIKFDTFIQKTKKLYVDTRTQRNLNKLNDEWRAHVEARARLRVRLPAAPQAVRTPHRCATFPTNPRAVPTERDEDVRPVRR